MWRVPPDLVRRRQERPREGFGAGGMLLGIADKDLGHRAPKTQETPLCANPRPLQCRPRESPL